MKNIFIIASMLFLLASCGINPGTPIQGALNNAYNKMNTEVSTGTINIPVHTNTKTQSGNIQDQSTSVKTLKIENYNVVLYSGDEKIKTLTTDGNTSESTFNNYCRIYSRPIMYKIYKNTGLYGLVQGFSGTCESEGGDIPMIYSFKNEGKLIDLNKQLHIYFGIVGNDQSQYYNPFIGFGEHYFIDDANNTLNIYAPNETPCDGYCTGDGGFIAPSLLQKKGLIRKNGFFAIPLDDLLQ